MFNMSVVTNKMTAIPTDMIKSFSPKVANAAEQGPCQSCGNQIKLLSEENKRLKEENLILDRKIQVLQPNLFSERLFCARLRLEYPLAANYLPREAAPLEKVLFDLIFSYAKKHESESDPKAVYDYFRYFLGYGDFDIWTGEQITRYLRILEESFIRIDCETELLLNPVNEFLNYIAIPLGMLGKKPNISNTGRHFLEILQYGTSSRHIRKDINFYFSAIRGEQAAIEELFSKTFEVDFSSEALFEKVRGENLSDNDSNSYGEEDGESDNSGSE